MLSVYSSTSFSPLFLSRCLCSLAYTNEDTRYCGGATKQCGQSSISLQISHHPDCRFELILCKMWDCLLSKTRSRRPLLCVENLEAAARKPQTNLAFESAGLAFVSSTSPTELVNTGRPHPLSSSTKVLPQADPRTYKSACSATLFPAAVLTRYIDHFFSVP